MNRNGYRPIAIARAPRTVSLVASLFMSAAVVAAGCASSETGTTDGGTGSGGKPGSAGTSGSGSAGTSGKAGTGGGTAGTNDTAGTTGAGSAGTNGTAGTTGAAGTSGRAGTNGAAGTNGTAGTAGTGGHAGAGGGTGGGGGSGSDDAGAGSGMLPGDIAATAGTPLVAAHSLTRALYAAYDGKLFQVRRSSDGTTQDISVASTGGPVNLSALTTFCTGTCGVSKLYDQAGNGNDLSQATAANQPAIQYWKQSDGTQVPMAVTTSRQWLRNRTSTKKIPLGSDPQTEYMVVHAAFAGAVAGTNGCCYDYGNMEVVIGDQGPGTMSALYFGSATDWTRGAGTGPWAMMDFENGLFAGGGGIANLNQGSASVNQQDPTIKYAGNDIAVVVGKTDGTKNFTLKYGDAATGALGTAWSGSLPTMPNPTPYIPLQQLGGLSLGEGGDGSNMGTGAFSEGVVIAAQTSDATDNAIQVNLVSVYGK